MEKIWAILQTLMVLFPHRINAPRIDGQLHLNEILAPFYHGVASGDPFSDSVIIWTRVTLSNDVTDLSNSKSGTNTSLTVEWEMSSDTSFEIIVASGKSETDSSNDFTVKIEVDGLSFNTYYYYRFSYDGDVSITGRTKTAPAANETSQIRFATVSCADYQSGYFNAYDRITERNDIDAVIHLGDYLYEPGNSEGVVRDHEPPWELAELADYRTRYSQYRLDESLRNLHQQYPFIVTWDDHEFANNAYLEGAQNHESETEGDWSTRLDNAVKAYNEWMPMRLRDPNNDQKIYRSFKYGDLVDLFMLDTRIIGRDKQLDFIDGINPEAYNDPDRQLLGTEQMEWLQNGLRNSTAQWKIIAQQVMVSPFRAFGFIRLNMDAWDGYGSERARLLDFIEKNNIENIVILTGDIHSSWAMDVPLGSKPYNPITGENSLAVEFITTSITSPGLDKSIFALFLNQFVKVNNPHMKYVKLSGKGYSILDITSERTQNDFYYVGSVRSKNTDHNYGASYFTRDKQNRVRKGESASSSSVEIPDLA